MYSLSNGFTSGKPLSSEICSAIFSRDSICLLYKMTSAPFDLVFSILFKGASSGMTIIAFISKICAAFDTP